MTALVRDKRRDAVRRQRMLRRNGPHLQVPADPRAHNVWVTLPSSWRAESFTAAAERGVAVAPATAFAVGSGHAPNAVRVALASPTPRVLAESLAILDELVRTGPQVPVIERPRDLEPGSTASSKCSRLATSSCEP